MLLAVFAALACLGSAIGADTPKTISSSAELFAAFAALPGTGNTTLLLQQSVILSAEDAVGYVLPFSVSPGETVRLRGGKPVVRTPPLGCLPSVCRSCNCKADLCCHPCLQQPGPPCPAWTLARFLCCWTSSGEGRWCWRT